MPKKKRSAAQEWREEKKRNDAQQSGIYRVQFACDLRLSVPADSEEEALSLGYEQIRERILSLPGDLEVHGQSASLDSRIQET